MYNDEYDRTDPKSIEKYAQRLIGKTFQEIIDQDKVPMVREEGVYGTALVAEKKRNKGNLGQIIEERFFHYRCNSDSNADFFEAGVELKVTPYKINQNGTVVAKERLILSMIDYNNVVKEKFEESHFWNKSKLLLLIYYMYLKEININLDYRIGYARLFTPPANDLMIIRQDYEFIVDKIKRGKAHELSEGDTFYLGAAPKASTAMDRRSQPYSDKLAKPRAFAFKSSYMTYVLNHYIIPGKDTYETIIKDNESDRFETIVENRINRNRGKSVEELCSEYGIDITRNPKNLESIIAFKMLGINGNKAEEFEKANIVVKTIRVNANGKIKESMSFPAFRFKELIQEKWEDSTFGNYLRETKFFFVVYQFDENGQLLLLGCKFWNIPYNDLEIEVRRVWEKTVEVLNDGLEIVYDGRVMRNNLPKASENRVCHVRPHARDSRDTYELPDGRYYPKQCFWLNNTYILSQIENLIK